MSIELFTNSQNKFVSMYDKPSGILILDYGIPFYSHASWTVGVCYDFDKIKNFVEFCVQYCFLEAGLQQFKSWRNFILGQFIEFPKNIYDQSPYFPINIRLALT